MALVREVLEEESGIDLEDKKTAPRCFRSVAKESVPVWGVSLFSYSLSDQKFCDAQEKGEIDYMVIKPA